MMKLKRGDQQASCSGLRGCKGGACLRQLVKETLAQGRARSLGEYDVTWVALDQNAFDPSIEQAIQFTHLSPGTLSARVRSFQRADLSIVGSSGLRVQGCANSAAAGLEVV